MNRINVLSNMAWRFLERCTTQGVNFIVSIILARLLSPEDYGTIALVTVFIDILQVFVQGGFVNSLIQKKDADVLDFSTVFYFQIFSCSFMYILLYLMAPFVADFYANTSLISVIRVLGVKLIISGLLSVQTAYVTKSLQFKKFFNATLIGAVISAVVGITMAYNGGGIWSLVAQTLVATLVSTAVLWSTVDFKPKLTFSFVRLKELFSYGWKILASGLLDSLYNNLKNLIVGKVYTTVDLGFYNKGEQFPKLIISSINTSMDNVLLASMSCVQDNKKRVKDMTRKSIKTSCYIIWPCMIGLFTCADSLVLLVLTEKWLSVIPYLRAFCIYYAFWPIQTANMSAIKAIGRSDVFLELQVIKKIIGVISIALVLHKGALAIALVGVVVAPIEVLINAYPNKKLINYNYNEQIKDVFPSILLSCAMGVVVWCIYFVDLSPICILLFQCFIGVIIYVLLSLIFKIETFHYILSILINIIEKFRIKEL